MPKLLVFVPCERVILSQGNNAVSLIILVEKIEMRIISTGVQPPVDKNAGFVANLSIFAEWLKLPADEGKIFEQRITLVRVNDPPVFQAITELSLSHRLHRIVGQVETLPYLVPGEYEFQLWLREKGQKWADEPIASYPIEVAHSADVLAHQ
jgi:hypothetical protein